jgi:hypothetical protein
LAGGPGYTDDGGGPPGRAADHAASGTPATRRWHGVAIVADEGHRHIGHAAIDAWWRDVTVRYQAVAEPLEVNTKDDVYEVRARVTGQFSGSPITLTFAFRMKDDRIAALEIGS